MSRMFDVVTHTWNPVVGCTHRCRYCWARRLVEEGRLKSRYGDFKPKFYPERLRKIPMKGYVFVVDMGDLFSDGVPDEWIKEVFKAIIYSGSKATFLFLTKNPRRYHDFLEYYRSNMLFGVTIESNRFYNLYDGVVPSPDERWHYMYMLPKEIRRFVSIEPILQFNYPKFWYMIYSLKPEIVYIGYDNYNNHLPEPYYDKTVALINKLKSLGLEVRLKTIRKAWWEDV